MKYVLDASVAIKWVIVEPDSNKATRLREDYRNAIHGLISPESFTIECAYSLTKKQRQRLLPDAGALGRDHDGRTGAGFDPPADGPRPRDLDRETP